MLILGIIAPVGLGRIVKFWVVFGPLDGHSCDVCAGEKAGEESPVHGDPVGYEAADGRIGLIRFVLG